MPSRHVRSRTSGLIGLMAVAAVTAALGVLALRAWRGIQTPLDAVLMLLMMAAGYLLADLLTGVVHWFCDTFFNEMTPFIGPGLIAPFREHHRSPLLMTQHDFLELTGSSFCGLAPLLAIFVWLGGAFPASVSAFVLALSAGAVGTNLLHRWAHEPSPSAFARALQWTGIVLTPERHAKHHQPPYAAGYCVTSGWMNPLCDRLNIWTRAEAALTALGLPKGGAHRDVPG